MMVQTTRGYLYGFLKTKKKQNVLTLARAPWSYGGGIIGVCHRRGRGSRPGGQIVDRQRPCPFARDLDSPKPTLEVRSPFTLLAAYRTCTSWRATGVMRYCHCTQSIRVFHSKSFYSLFQPEHRMTNNNVVMRSIIDCTYRIHLRLRKNFSTRSFHLRE
jgi:hypothetical protein